MRHHRHFDRSPDLASYQRESLVVGILYAKLANPAIESDGSADEQPSPL